MYAKPYNCAQMGQCYLLAVYNSDVRVVLCRNNAISVKNEGLVMQLTCTCRDCLPPACSTDTEFGGEPGIEATGTTSSLPPACPTSTCLASYGRPQCTDGSSGCTWTWCLDGEGRRGRGGDPGDRSDVLKRRSRYRDQQQKEEKPLKV